MPTRTSKESALKNADDLESAALASGLDVPTPLDEGLYDDNIADFEPENDQLPHDTVEHAFRVSSLEEDLIADALAIIETRCRLLGDYYPFVVEGSHLTYRGSRTLVYEYCLATSTVQDISQQQFRPLREEFEVIAALALKIRLGPAAGFLRTGYPFGVDTPHESLRDALESLSEPTPEQWMWDSQVEDQHVFLNDGGVDGIVWLPFDSRPGSLLFALNCTCGRNWMNQRKHLEFPANRIARYLSRPLKEQFRNVFAIPFHLHHELESASDQGQVVLDRIRLTLLLGDLSPGSLGEHLGTSLSDLISIARADYRPSLREQLN